MFTRGVRYFVTTRFPLSPYQFSWSTNTCETPEGFFSHSVRAIAEHYLRSQVSNREEVGARNRKITPLTRCR